LSPDLPVNDESLPEFMSMQIIQSTQGLKMSLALGMSLALTLACPIQVSAAPIDLVLTRTSTLTNVDDSEGLWQYDGGEVSLGGDLVGYYARKKRVSDGVILNAATVEMTLFADGASPPQNLTLLGSHSFNSGDEIGSVSAASSDFSAFIGIQFSIDGASDVLTLEAP
jgi:hypothetical protein